jgi:hypothetical protein
MLIVSYSCLLFPTPASCLLFPSLCFLSSSIFPTLPSYFFISPSCFLFLRPISDSVTCALFSIPALSFLFLLSVSYSSFLVFNYSYMVPSPSVKPILLTTSNFCFLLPTPAACFATPVLYFLILLPVYHSCPLPPTQSLIS